MGHPEEARVNTPTLIRVKTNKVHPEVNILKIEGKEREERRRKRRREEGREEGREERDERS